MLSSQHTHVPYDTRSAANATVAAANNTIDFISPPAIEDNRADTNAQHIYHDSANNFTFTLTRRNGTAYISPLETAGRTELKVGVLLPFHQNDNDWTKIITLSGASAIRMAVAEINTRNLIPGAYITLIEQDSYPKEVQGQAAITQAVYSAVSLMHEGVIAVIGDITSSWTALSALMTSTLQIPQCSFSAIATSLSDKTEYSYFFRTIPTDLIFTDAMLTFVANQGWPTIGILFSGDTFGKQLSKDIIMKARTYNIAVKGYQPFLDHGPKSNVKRSIDTLMATGARIILVAATDDAAVAALVTAAHNGYINKDTVWLAIRTDTDALWQAVISFNHALSLRNNTGPTNSTAVDPIVRMAEMTQDTTPIQYNSTFSGGVFIFDSVVNLPGYAPFDQFLQRWASLDPSIYPYGGQRNISGNEGYAYSCMMTLAQGFGNILRDATNASHTLNHMAYRQLGAELNPSVFNTTYVGPGGPIILDQNGDLTIGSYQISNVQNGIGVPIGNIVAGELHLTSPPIYYDGSTHIPTGVPPKMYLNPGYSTPLSIILVTVSGIGTLLALISLCLVLLYRNRNAFKASNVLFCILELVGFILCYISAFVFTGDRSKLTCIIVPVAFNLGYSMVMGNLVAKNYRIYHVFNNIFVTHTGIGDKQLLKVSGGLLLLETTVLVLWLCICSPHVIAVPVSSNAYYKACSYNGSSHMLFVTLLTLIAACELAFAIFLAFKTRFIGKTYSKYSEFKQIGMSIYNIFFSALIGAVVFFLPTTDYYTQHYLTATMIVWATTFCLFALFLPKFLQLCKPPKDGYPVKNKISDLPGRQQSFLSDNSKHGSAAHDVNEGTAYHQQKQQQQQSFGELLSMNGVLNGKDVHQSPYRNSNTANHHHPQNQHQQFQLLHRQLYHRIHATVQRTKTPSSKPKKHITRQKGQVLDAYEAQMPIRRVLKYFPLLSSWTMQQLVLMPGASYFSHFSEHTGKGHVVGYSHASVVSSTKDAYIFKVHGLHFYDILIQVANQDDLQQWCQWLNSKPTQPAKNHHPYFFLTKSKTTESSGNAFANALNKAISTQHSQKQHQHQPNLDSGMTMRHLLAEDDDFDKRQASCLTLATLGSHLDQPASHEEQQPVPLVSFTTTTNVSTPISEDRTIIASPCTNDNDVIIMHDL